MRTAIVIILVLLVAACAKKRGEPTMFTGVTLSTAQIQAQIPGVVSFGKASYAQVSRAWVEWFYSEYRANLSEGAFGVVHWDGRFTCTSFVTKFCADAQMRYFAQSFHTGGAPSIGIGEFWFQPAGDWSRPGHALVVCFTENGREFFEPQTGKWVNLTPAELAASRHRKFD